MNHVARSCIALIVAGVAALASPSSQAAYRDHSGDLTKAVTAPETKGEAASPEKPRATLAPSLASSSVLPYPRSIGYATGLQPRTVTAADLNADGHPELIVPANGANTAMILYGTADGVYEGSPRVTLTDGASNGQKAAVADFNADGLPDIAIVHYFDGIFVWLQNLDGTFGSGGTWNQSLALAGNFHRCVASGDLNGDGAPDLVATAETGSVHVWYGPGAFGSWINGGSYTTAGSVSDWVDLADFNGDGLLDAAVTNDDPSNTISILFGTGFTGASFNYPSVFPVGSGPNTCVATDLNGDARPDVLIASWNVQPFGSSVTALLNQGGGYFVATVYHPFGLPEEEAFAVAAADVTGDGIVDGIVANGVHGTVSVLPGNGNGSFATHRSYGAGYAARGIAVADLNGDGRPDIATSNLNANTVQVLLADAQGYAGSVSRAGSDTPASFNVDDRLVASLAQADFNGDGHLDLATVHPAAGTVSVTLGAGDGTFSALPDIPVAGNPQAVAAGDFDRDGMMDLAAANEANGTVSVLYGEGDGTFKGKNSFGVGAGPIDLVAADMNGDGRLDLVTANTGGNVSVLLKNPGGGGFKDRIQTELGTLPSGLAVADVNGDGRMDVAVSLDFFGFAVLYGNGDGTFASPQYFSSGYRPGKIALGDLDQDGLVDVALSTPIYNGALVYRATGYGWFQFAGFYGGMSEARRLTIGDVDGNGWPEIVVGARLGHAYVVYPFDPAPPMGARIWGLGSCGGAVVLADADEDGATDLLTLNARSQVVSFLRNESSGGASLASGRLASSATPAIARVSVSPNPLNPSAVMRFTLASPGPLRVRLFDARGRLVRTLLDEPQAAAGERRIAVNGANGRGNPLSTGVYFYRIETARGNATGRITVLK